MSNEKQLMKLVQSCIGTKFISRWEDLAVNIAIDAVKKVTVTDGNHKEIDTKRYAKIEKIPGGSMEDSKVLQGVMFNKDVCHPKMARRIENPRFGYKFFMSFLLLLVQWPKDK
jgi:T-complex protein 1 subunit gamma